MWKLELEEYYFRIYDSKKQIAGYFDPDYGEKYDPDDEDNAKIIDEMLKNHDSIIGGFLTLPMAKFGIFGSSDNMTISYLENQLNLVKSRISLWGDFIGAHTTDDPNTESSHKHDDHKPSHFIQVSHTDQDMLSITIPILFSKPTILVKDEILKEIQPILDQLQKLALL
jgi:hypothetical protein